MRKLIGIMLMLAAPVAAQERRAVVAPESPVILSGERCGVFVKGVGIHFAELQPAFAAGVDGTSAGDLKLIPVEFWRGPYSSLTEAQAAVVEVATVGSWGTRFVDGYRNTTYTREFFPPSRVVKTEHLNDCLR